MAAATLLFLLHTSFCFCLPVIGGVVRGFFFACYQSIDTFWCCVVDALLFWSESHALLHNFSSSGETGPGSAPPTFHFFFSVSSAFVVFCEEKKAKIAR